MTVCVTFNWVFELSTAAKGYQGTDMSIGGDVGGGFILLSGSSNILFIPNTKSSGRFNQTHNDFLWAPSVVLGVVSETKRCE